MGTILGDVYVLERGRRQRKKVTLEGQEEGLSEKDLWVGGRFIILMTANSEVFFYSVPSFCLHCLNPFFSKP